MSFVKSQINIGNVKLKSFVAANCSCQTDLNSSVAGAKANVTKRLRVFLKSNPQKVLKRCKSEACCVDQMS